MNATAPAIRFADIEAAAGRLAGVAVETPLLESQALNARLSARVLIKPETLQPVGAFKIRGAYNMVAQLEPSERQRGVITYSSGNHGQAVAISARALGIPAVVVMPTTAPRVKVDGVAKFGGEVVFAGTTTLHRRAKAEALAGERGLTMVPPFDHEWIVAGQGTLGLEILDQCPNVGTILVPVGGGGLVAGVAAAVKQTRKEVAVVGVEPSGAASMKYAADAGEVRTLEGAHSIADGLMAVRAGDLPFALVQKYVDRLVTVEEEEIAAAVRWLFSEAKLVAEPSGAVTVAAALRAEAGYTPPVVAVISGGNLDPSRLAHYLGAA